MYGGLLINCEQKLPVMKLDIFNEECCVYCSQAWFRSKVNLFNIKKGVEQLHKEKKLHLGLFMCWFEVTATARIAGLAVNDDDWLYEITV